MRKQDILAALFPKNDSVQDNQPKIEKILFFLFLIASFFGVLIIYFKANSTYDTGDGIVHYQIARYSWKYPTLFLDLWGKPFFTLISSPFAQFGLKGMYVFQAMNAAAISWFLFSIAQKINLKYAWTIPAFVFFAPVYFAIMNSGLVEILFGTMFMFSVWLVFNKKYYASALVASIIPFVRPEAYVVMPLLAFIYAYRRKFWAIPLLSTATIVITIIGYLHFKDIFWIINNNYQLVGDNYAGMKGSYLHYFGLYYQIWGPPFAVLLILGIGVIISQVYQLFRRESKHEFVEEVFVLFLGSGVGSFILHSLLYAMPGILNNIGMLRYMAVLIPSSAFIALIGLNLLNLGVFSKNAFIKPLLVISILILLVLTSFLQPYYPFKPNNEQHVIKQMAGYIKKTSPDFKKVCYLHPMLPIYADLDPYDTTRIATLWAGDLERLNQLPDSTLFIWDSHFMKMDGRIPFDWLSENPNFIMLKHYEFGTDYHPFNACLFIRANNPMPVSVPVEVVYPDGLISGISNTDTIEYTFENDTLDFNNWIDLFTSFAERNAVEFKPELEGGPTFEKLIGDISENGRLKSVTMKFNINQTDTVNDLVGVIDISNRDTLVFWEGMIIKQPIIAGQWNSIELQHSFSEPLKNNDLKVKIYIWNKGKQRFYIDDFKIIFQSISDLE